MTLQPPKPKKAVAKKIFGSPKGQYFEAVAVRYLTEKGLTLIEKNFTSRFGELDLIMQSSPDDLIFVEVKFRTSADYGSGLETITYHKQKKIMTAAKHFLNRHKQFQQRPTRFDVLAISPKSPQSEPPSWEFDWIVNAFDIGDCFSCL